MVDSSCVPWPPYSSDLLPLNHYFWGFANAEAGRQKPPTIGWLRIRIAALKAVVEEVSLSGDVLRAVMAIFWKSRNMP